MITWILGGIGAIFLIILIDIMITGLVNRRLTSLYESTRHSASALHEKCMLRMRRRECPAVITVHNDCLTITPVIDTATEIPLTDLRLIPGSGMIKYSKYPWWNKQIVLISNGLDILPTLCDYAGAAIPATLTGKSFRPICEGRPPEAWRDDLYLENEFGFAVVGRNAKYACYNNGKGRNNEQLYDLVHDPHETRNAGIDPDTQAELAHFRERLNACQQLYYGGPRTVQDFQ